MDDVLTMYDYEKLQKKKPVNWKKMSKEKRKIKMELARVDGLKCFYCDRTLKMSKATLDHIYPKSKLKESERTYGVNNSVLACFKCNSKKSDRIISIEEFRKEVMGAHYIPSKSYRIPTKVEKPKKIKTRVYKQLKPPSPNVAQGVKCFKEIIFVEQKLEKRSLGYKILRALGGK